jgi:hypothetical protein
MKRIDSCPSIVETAAFFDGNGLMEDAQSLERGFGRDMARVSSNPDLTTVRGPPAPRSHATSVR